MDGRDGSNARQNLNDAFEIAERELGIDRLIDIEDIVDVARPDEKAVMTQVAQYYAYFSGLDKYETAGRRIANFLLFQKQIAEMQHDYEERTRILQGNANSFSEEFNNAQLNNTYAETIRDITGFRDYRKTKRREMIKERDELVSLFNQINLKLKSQGLNPYVPPHGLSVDDTSRVLENLASAESNRRSSLNQRLRDIQERAQKKFADLANDFFNSCNTIKDSVKSLHGDLEHQLHTVSEEQNKINHLEHLLPVIKEAEDEQLDANVEVNNYSDQTYDDLTFELDQLKKLIQKTSELIRAQIAASKSTGISQEKLIEFQEAFNHFDLDKDGLLNRLELKSALSSLGLVDIDFVGGDKKFDDLYKKLSQGGDMVHFEQFADFMNENLTDKMERSQLDESFQTLGGGKGYVTVEDLRKAGVDNDTVEYIQLKVPPRENGYDYQAFLNNTFTH